MSGDKCDNRGLYWASGCGHAAALALGIFEEFPDCRTCGKQIKWIPQKPAEN